MRSTSKVARPKGYKKVLTFEAYKTSKSKDFGYLTAILYMSPGEEIRRYQYVPYGYR